MLFFKNLVLFCFLFFFFFLLSFLFFFFFFFSSRRRHTRFDCDWSSDVCSSDLTRAWRGARPDRCTPLRCAGFLLLPSNRLKKCSRGSRGSNRFQGHRSTAVPRSVMEPLGTPMERNLWNLWNPWNPWNLCETYRHPRLDGLDRDERP